jgi:hypothetical protein
LLTRAFRFIDTPTAHLTSMSRNNNSLPEDWSERTFIPGCPITLGQHCSDLALATVGAADNTITKVLQVYKPLMKSLGISHYPFNSGALKRRLGMDHWCNRKVRMHSAADPSYYNLSIHL